MKRIRFSILVIILLFLYAGDAISKTPDEYRGFIRTFNGWDAEVHSIGLNNLFNCGKNTVIGNVPGTNQYKSFNWKNGVYKDLKYIHGWRARALSCSKDGKYLFYLKAKKHVYIDQATQKKRLRAILSSHLYDIEDNRSHLLYNNYGSHEVPLSPSGEYYVTSKKLTEKIMFPVGLNPKIIEQRFMKGSLGLDMFWSYDENRIIELFMATKNERTVYGISVFNINSRKTLYYNISFHPRLLYPRKIKENPSKKKILILAVSETDKDSFIYELDFINNHIDLKEYQKADYFDMSSQGSLLYTVRGLEKYPLETIKSTINIIKDNNDLRIAEFTIKKNSSIYPIFSAEEDVIFVTISITEKERKLVVMMRSNRQVDSSF